ncbi:MAG TPA: flagellar biosynthesis protein FliQ [Phycisphaerales bacterium]|nr:flagellar biosynthesis protein FliQ [Phycisphaerales bacterium]
MYDESLVYLVRETILLTLKIVLPILGAGVVVGLVISILQSVTSIQDQTLTFVPKIVVMLAVVVFLTPWIVQRLGEFASDLLWVAIP